MRENEEREKTEFRDVTPQRKRRPSEESKRRQSRPFEESSAFFMTKKQNLSARKEVKKRREKEMREEDLEHAQRLEWPRPVEEMPGVREIDEEKEFQRKEGGVKEANVETTEAEVSVQVVEPGREVDERPSNTLPDGQKRIYFELEGVGVMAPMAQLHMQRPKHFIRPFPTVVPLSVYLASSAPLPLI